MLKAVAAFVMIAISGLGLQAAEARAPCPEYLRLRNAASESWTQAMRGPPSERCLALDHASWATEETLNYANNNRKSCGIPELLLDQLEGYHRETVRARDNVCAGRPARPFPPDIIQR